MTIRDVQVQNVATVLGKVGQYPTEPLSPQVSGEVVFLTVTQAADSVTLAVGYAPGARVLIRNVTALAAVIFPPKGGTINGGAVDASAAIVASKATEFVCASGNGKNWYAAGLSA